MLPNSPIIPSTWFSAAVGQIQQSGNAQAEARAVLVQELWQDPLAILEIFGRKTFLRDIWDNPHWLVEEYSVVEPVPGHHQRIFHESFFQDADHLARTSLRSNAFYSWPMPPTPYDEARDRDALELYMRYNKRDEGIRLDQSS